MSASRATASAASTCAAAASRSKAGETSIRRGGTASIGTLGGSVALQPFAAGGGLVLHVEQVESLERTGDQVQALGIGHGLQPLGRLGGAGEAHPQHALAEGGHHQARLVGPIEGGGGDGLGGSERRSWWKEWVGPGRY